MASICKSNFMLPTSTIVAAAWLSVNHLTCVDFNRSVKDLNENSIADSFLQVELFSLSQSAHILWQIVSSLSVMTDPQPVTLASE